MFCFFILIFYRVIEFTELKSIYGFFFQIDRNFYFSVTPDFELLKISGSDSDCDSDSDGCNMDECSTETGQLSDYDENQM